MAQIAARYSHLALLTSDNPRSEDPEAILAEMVAGLTATDVSQEKYRSLVDRREAIQFAMNQAKPGDVVLIAGKGHETYRIIKTRCFILMIKKRQLLPYYIRTIWMERVRKEAK